MQLIKPLWTLTSHIWVLKDMRPSDHITLHMCQIVRRQAVPNYSEHRPQSRRLRTCWKRPNRGAAAQALRVDKATGSLPPTAAGPSNASAATAISDIHQLQLTDVVINQKLMEFAMDPTPETAHEIPAAPSGAAAHDPQLDQVGPVPPTQLTLRHLRSYRQY